MEKRKINFQMLIIVILVITLTSVTIFAVNKETEKISNSEPEKIYVGTDDKILDNFSKEDAVSAMRDVLISIDEDIEGEDRTIEERMEVMDKEDSDIDDVISKNTIDKLYLEEEFENDKFNRQFTASALLTFRKMTENLKDKEEDMNAISEVLDELVYIDNKLMTAHIPADVFTGDSRGFAFQMEYIDGKWKYNPYTSMMALVLIINYQVDLGDQ